MLLATLQSNGQDYPEKMDWLSISPKVVTKMPITQAYIDSMNKAGSVINGVSSFFITSTPITFKYNQYGPAAILMNGSDTLEMLDLSRIHYIKISGKVFKIQVDNVVNLVPELDQSEKDYLNLIKSLRQPVKLKKPQ